MIEKDITTTYISGTTSCTLIIRKDIAKRYGIDEPSHVIVEGTKRGILIRKLKLKENEEGSSCLSCGCNTH